MKVTYNTAYVTIGCDVQLSENDRLALGIELDKVTNWLETVIGDKTVTEDSYKAINNLVAFVSKFAICPSQSNVFTDNSIEEFKKADKTTTTVEQVPEDNTITVYISNCKNSEAAMTTIIHCATGVECDEVNNCINTAKGIHMSCISFECTRRPKEKIIDELVCFGYIVASNKTPSLTLKEKCN